MTPWRTAAAGLAILSLSAPALAQYNPGNNAGSNGGFNPNASAQSNNRGSATEQRLRRSEQEDSGRGLEWFYLTAGGGAEYVNLTALSKSGDLLLGKSTSGAAPSASVALGVRLLTLTIGARGRVDILSDYKLLSVDPEIGLHLPSGDFEPYFLLGGGYSRLLGLGGDASGKSIGGYNLRLAGGIDYYLTPYFSIGGQINADMVHLGRDAVAQAVQIDSSASSLGVAVGGALVLGLHL